MHAGCWTHEGIEPVVVADGMMRARGHVTSLVLTASWVVSRIEL